MQLSKQEFSKLPQSEKNKLMRLKGNNKPNKNGTKKKKGPNGVKSKANGNITFAPAAMSSSFRGSPPKITRDAKSCRVIHRELIASITGSVAFTVSNTFALNPGLPATFPWLSLIAQAWEEYQFNSLKFHFVTRTGTNVPGSVMLAPDFDAADSAPADEATASSYESAVEDAPWKNIVCVLKKGSMNSSRTRHFVRTAALAANLDIKTYDVGNLFVLTVDGTAVPWGKLWVEYDISFYIPQLPSAGVGPFGGTVLSTGASETAANPFGTAPAVDAQAKGIAMNTASVLEIQQPGDYIVTADFIGTVITAVSAVVLGAGVAITAPVQLSVFDAAATNAITRFGVRVSADTAALPATIAFALTATTITSGRVSVGAVPVGATV